MADEQGGEGDERVVKVPKLKVPAGWWRRRSQMWADTDVRSGSGDWGTHGKGDRAVTEGRRSRRLRARGGKQAIKQAIEEEAVDALTDQPAD